MKTFDPPKRTNLTKYAWLSIVVAFFTITLKGIAYLVTGSVGFLSDALESFVNLAGALMTLGMLTIAARPADEDHAYGHSKAEYFSSGVEGTLILVAAVLIIYTAIERLINPQLLEQVGIGLIVSVLASLANLGASLILKRAGKQYNSVSLTSNANHLMTDVWTSGGVLIAVAAVSVTGWNILDPIIGIIVALNIVWTGVGIIKTSISGLMDSSLPKTDLLVIQGVLESIKDSSVRFHALRTRQSGTMKVVSLHVLVPGSWSVDQGHRLVTQIEAEIGNVLEGSVVFTHLESLSDPASYDEEIPEKKHTPPAP